MATFTIDAVRNNYSARGRGATYFSFVALPQPDGESYSAWQRPDNLPGAVVLSRVQHGARSSERHSGTVVEVELPDGAIIKCVAKGAREAPDVQRVRGGELTNGGVAYIGTQRNGDGWRTVLEIDGVRIAI